MTNLLQSKLVSRWILGNDVFLLISKSIVIQVVGYAIALCLTPISIAFYSPTDFGAIGIVVFIATLVGTFGGMRLDWAVINERSSPVAGYLMRFGLTLIIVAAVIADVIILMMPISILDQIKVNRWDLLFVTPIAIAIGFGAIQQAWGIRFKSYRNVYLSRNTVIISRPLIQIMLGAVPSLLGLLTSELLSRLIGIAIIRWRLSLSVLPLGAGRFFRQSRSVLFGRYGHYSRVGLPASILDFVISQALTFLLVPLFGLEVAGAYWLVQRIFATPLALIGTVTGEVFQGQIARISDARALRRLLLQVGGLLAVVSIVALPVATMAFWLLTQRLYGGKWALSGELALSLLPVTCLQLIASPLSRILIVKQKMQYSVLFNLLQAGSVAIWCSIASAKILGLIESMVLFSATQSICYIIYIYFFFRVTSVAGVKRN